MTADGTTSPAVSRRRGLGLGLLAFGASGLVLIAAAAVLLFGSLSAVDAAASGFERQRVQILAMLGPASDALEGAATSATNAGSSLTETSEAASRAASLTTRLAESFEGLTALSAFEVLGTRPFGALGGQFAAVASDARALSTDLADASALLATNIADSAAVAEDLLLLSEQLEELEVSLAGTPGSPTTSPDPTLPLDLARLVVAGLLIWLAIPAIASIGLGWRLLRLRALG